jgi:hypothetical protein
MHYQAELARAAERNEAATGALAGRVCCEMTHCGQLCPDCLVMIAAGSTAGRCRQSRFLCGPAWLHRAFDLLTADPRRRGPGVDRLPEVSVPA